jgi:LmbE family N-acetylglucosaminyl deacetylase
MRASSAAVVVAHPDDEALWLSAALAAAERVVFCFGEVFGKPALSLARRRAVAALPFADRVDLAIPESGAGHSPGSVEPERTATGIAIGDAAARARYDSNYPRLIEGLRTTLAAVRDVYTHNPWGEYGHPEHIQVHRAVSALQAELGYTICFSNYVSPASWPLARRLGNEVRWAERRVLRPDLAAARSLMRVYRTHGAWTWHWAHRWPTLETLYAVPPAGISQMRHPLTGEWLLDVKRLRWWPLPRSLARRRLQPAP